MSLRPRLEVVAYMGPMLQCDSIPDATRWVLGERAFSEHVLEDRDEVTAAYLQVLHGALLVTAVSCQDTGQPKGASWCL